MSWWSYKPYVSVAQKQAKATKQLRKLQKAGQSLSPVSLEGKTIAHTFWGKAWCDNVDSYSDFDNRLPRGRSYVRNGAVIDLQIESGRITALVQGSDLYKVQIDLKPATAKSWREIQQACAGQIGSLIELLQGKLSKGVMEIITRPGSGLFPKPGEIKKSCSCYDWADVCKHVAAAMYGVGARLDQSPELLFKLRQVDHLELITQAGNVTAITNVPTDQKTIAQGDLADVFGIELEPVSPAKAVVAIGSPSLPKPATDHRSKAAGKAKGRRQPVSSASIKKGKPLVQAASAVRRDPANAKSSKRRASPGKTAVTMLPKSKRQLSPDAGRN